MIPKLEIYLYKLPYNVKGSIMLQATPTVKGTRPLGSIHLKRLSEINSWSLNFEFVNFWMSESN